MMISSIFPGIYQQAQKSQQLSGSLAFLGWWFGRGLRNHNSSRNSAFSVCVPSGSVTPKRDAVATGGDACNKGDTGGTRCFRISDCGSAGDNNSNNGRAAAGNDIGRGRSRSYDELIENPGRTCYGWKRDRNTSGAVQEEHTSAVFHGKRCRGGSNTCRGRSRTQDCTRGWKRQLRWAGSDEFKWVATCDEETGIHDVVL